MARIVVSDRVYTTTESLQFIDITDDVAEFVRKQNVYDGLVTICSQHTTMAVVINEGEELLLKDIRDHLYEFAPLGKLYRHDDLAKRKCPSDEPKNYWSAFHGRYGSRGSLQPSR